MKNKKFLTWQRGLVVITPVLVMIFISWIVIGHAEKKLACRADFILQPASSRCADKPILRFFMALNANGEGYILLSTERQCGGKTAAVTNDIVDFTYSKNGNSYDLNPVKGNDLIEQIFDWRFNHSVKIKISQIDPQRYLIASRDRAVMVCTASKG